MRGQSRIGNEGNHGHVKKKGHCVDGRHGCQAHGAFALRGLFLEVFLKAHHHPIIHVNRSSVENWGEAKMSLVAVGLLR